MTGGTGPDAVPGHSSGGLAAQIHKANLGASSGGTAGGAVGGGLSTSSSGGGANATAKPKPKVAPKGNGGGPFKVCLFVLPTHTIDKTTYANHEMNRLHSMIH